MERKKVLIIAHFYEPCNVIAAHRPKSWAIALQDAGFEPVVVTRHWTGTENNWIDFLAENTSPKTETQVNGIRVVSLPYKQTRFHKLATTPLARKFKVIRFGIEWLASIIGCVEIDRDINVNYHNEISQLLAKEHFSLILVTCNPNIGLKLGKRLAEQFKIPFVVDFRDLWNINVQLKDKASIPLVQKVRYYFYDRYMTKWIQKANHIIVCNETYIPYLDGLAPNIEKTVIKNGYEAALFNQFQDTSKDNPLFTILCLGTLHLEQDKQLFARAFSDFLVRNPDAKIQLKFLGVQVNPLVGKEIETLFPKKHLITTAFVKREDALRELKAAHILYYPAWPNYVGIYPGKLFEYLGAGKNLLIAPNDFGLLEKTLKETSAGFIYNSVDECQEQLQRWYAEWSINGTINYNGNYRAIEHYTREFQASLFVELINKLLNPK